MLLVKKVSRLLVTDGHIKPKAEIDERDDADGYGPYYRSTESEAKLVFFQLGVRYGSSKMHVLKYDLHELITEYGAKIRFEIPGTIKQLNTKSDNAFSIHGEEGSSAYKMLAAIKEHLPDKLSGVEVVVKGKVPIASAFETNILTAKARDKYKIIAEMMFNQTDFQALSHTITTVKKAIQTPQAKKPKDKWILTLKVGETIIRTETIEATTLLSAKDQAREAAKANVQFNMYMKWQPKWYKILGKTETYRRSYYSGVSMQLTKEIDNEEV